MLVGDFQSTAALLKCHSRYEQDPAIQQLAKLIPQLNVGVLHEKDSCETFVEVQKVRMLTAAGFLRLPPPRLSYPVQHIYLGIEQNWLDRARSVSQRHRGSLSRLAQRARVSERRDFCGGQKEWAGC